MTFSSFYIIVLSLTLFIQIYISNNIIFDFDTQPEMEANEQEIVKKAQKRILDLNKNGLNCLSNQKTISQSHEYLKKAQKAALEELAAYPDNKKLNQLTAITYNNLACYYKKNGKPKVALSYLKRALQIQVFKVENWMSTASTHLNICAIYSFLKKHQQAAQHAILALKMLGKVDLQEVNQLTNSKQEIKTYWNIFMLSNYNAAIELEYLKKYQKSEEYFSKTKQVAQKNKEKNQTLIQTCQQAIKRVENQKKVNNLRLVQIIAKRKQQQVKGNHQFMRKNKKNYQRKDDWRSVLNDRGKYAEYKAETEGTQSRKKYQSAGKLQALKLVTVKGKQTSRGSLHQN